MVPTLQHQVRGFHRPGRSTMNSSEGRWGDPRWGGTRGGSSFSALGTPPPSSFPGACLSKRGPELSARILGILSPLFHKLLLRVPVYVITADRLHRPAAPLRSNPGSRAVPPGPRDGSLQRPQHGFPLGLKKHGLAGLRRGCGVHESWAASWCQLHGGEMVGEHLPLASLHVEGG